MREWAEIYGIMMNQRPRYQPPVTAAALRSQAERARRWADLLPVNDPGARRLREAAEQWEAQADRRDRHDDTHAPATDEPTAMLSAAE